MSLMHTILVALLCGASVRAQHQVAVKKHVPHWSGTQLKDLHREYYNIFKHGNRNAASHLWSSFLIERSHQMTAEKFEYFFGGFCAVSGSPVDPRDQTRYRLTLDQVGGGRKRSGFMYYCCWPCVCDTQDFIKVDTKTVETLDGPRQFHFAVLGNPCDNPQELKKPFVQPFDRRETTLEREAMEVRCGPNGELEGATLSDHGYTIINMFFDHEGSNATTSSQALRAAGPPQPGRMTSVGGLSFSDEFEWVDMCEDRKEKGYNSGMGEIFRKVAAISMIPQMALDQPMQVTTLPGTAGNNENLSCTGPPDTCDWTTQMVESQP